ncbi:MAG: two-component regulator propeller domain-containing protein, partial [Ignavibacteria bacterium]
MPVHFKICVALLSTIFLSGEVNAQIKIHKTLTTENELAQGQVNVMLQDSRGYLWFGTFDGVSRWDGVNFINIGTHNGLPASQILDIEEGRDSTVYIAAYGGGILTIK